jgi:hypothetical protein
MAVIPTLTVRTRRTVRRSPAFCSLQSREAQQTRD